MVQPRKKFLTYCFISIPIATTSIWVSMSTKNLLFAHAEQQHQVIPAKQMLALTPVSPAPDNSRPSSKGAWERGRAFAVGNQISLNNRTFPFTWSQWQSPDRVGAVRIGISDAGLVRILGAELLSSLNINKQPIQWFSSPDANSLVLATRLTGQYRYLDITDLAKTSGWQIKPNGTTLEITTPAATIQQIHPDKQDWGERIVIDLDRPTPWQVIQEATTLTVRIDALANPSLPDNSPVTSQTFGPPESTSLLATSLVTTETQDNQTVLKLSIPNGLRPRVWSLTNPNRIVIDLAPEVLQELDINWAQGLRYRQQIINLGSERFPVVWLEINPRQSGLILKPIWGNSNTLVGISPLVQIGNTSGVAAAINGGYFNRNVQLPLGAIRRDGNWISSPILNRGAIAWNNKGEFKIAHLTLQETLVTSSGQHLPIVSSNSGYLQSGIARHTPDWGTSYTPLTDNETLIVVQNNQVQNILPGGVIGQNSFPIPPKGYLLVIRGNLNWQPEAYLPIGTKVKWEGETIPAEFNRYPQIIGAGPVLLQNRQIVLDAKAEQFRESFIKESAHRSVIATTARGKILIAAVGNRTSGAGPTLSEIAQISQRLGAIDALNLDGGSSTSLYLGGQLINRSPSTAARVHNGLGFYLRSNQ